MSSAANTKLGRWPRSTTWKRPQVSRGSTVVCSPIAQAAHIELTLTQQIVMLVSFMLSSKGVAGVPRATLVIIAGTCEAFGLPGEAGIAMILAVDEVMDMARTAVNVTGNAIASVVIARWESVLGPPADPAGPIDAVVAEG